MGLNRRRFLALGTAASVATVSRAPAATLLSSFGLDASHFGLRPGSPDDQSAAMQRVIDDAARLHVPVALPPGTYRVGNLQLPAGTQLLGVRGATKLMLADGPGLIAAEHADGIALIGLMFDGMGKPLAPRRGLIHIESARSIRITDCNVANAGGTAIQLLACEGELTENRITNAADAAIHSDDAQGLIIAKNSVIGAGNNGILVWRSEAGDDGTIVTDNRIEAIANRAGGSGQYGNAINVFRAGSVIVKDNRIRNCAFSAVRGNAASNIHIEGNAISDAREVALYSEFGFEGAIIANNSVDGAAMGVSVTNFNDGGRLAVVQGNLIRNLNPRRPEGTDPNDGAGIGIAVEADSAVTGNVVENAPMAGIVLGYGRYLRDVAATGNVVRRTGIGIAVSVAEGAGPALIANNVISQALKGAIVGMDRRKVVTGDLTKDGAEQYAQLTLTGNRVS